MVEDEQKSGQMQLSWPQESARKRTSPPEASAPLGPGELWLAKHRDEGPGWQSVPSTVSHALKAVPRDKHYLLQNSKRHIKNSS